MASLDPDPFCGTWELDPSTLDYECGRPGRRATYLIEAAGNGLVFSLDGEDADGRPVQVQYGGPTDGTELPLPANGAVVLVLRRTGDHCVESILRSGDRVLDRWTRELSDDGRTMLLTQYVPKPDGGECLNRSLYRRVR